jgi:hypothetical protein
LDREHDAGGPDLKKARETTDPLVVRGVTSNIRSLWTAVHYVALAAAAVALVVLNQHQWFIGDEWSFIAQRKAGDLLSPHNGHWTSLPLLVFRGLDTLFGLGSYRPYVLVLIVAHLIATHLLWRVMRRSGVAPGLATGLCAIFALLGAGYENLLWAFQISFVGALALGLAFLLLTDHDGGIGRLDRLGWLAGLATMMCSGVALTMIGVVGLNAVMRRGWKTGFIIVGPPLGAYLLWSWGWGWRAVGSDADLSLPVLLQLPGYVWKGLTATFAQSVGHDGGGPALLLCFLIWVARVPTGIGHRKDDLNLACAAGAVSLFLIAALVRLGNYTVEQSQSSRYLYLSAALLLPLVGSALSSLSPESLGSRVILPVVGVMVLVHGVNVLRAEAEVTGVREQASRAVIAAAARIAFRHERVIADEGEQFARPEPVNAASLSFKALRQLVSRGELPVEAKADPLSHLAAATQLQLSRTSRPMWPLEGASRPRLLGTRSDPFESIEEPGCVSILESSRPEFTIAIDEPASLLVKSARAGSASLLLKEKDGRFARYPDAERSPWVRLVRLASGKGRFVNIAAHPVILEINFPGDGEATVCGLSIPGS